MYIRRNIIALLWQKIRSYGIEPVSSYNHCSVECDNSNNNQNHTTGGWAGLFWWQRSQDQRMHTLNWSPGRLGMVSAHEKPAFVRPPLMKLQPPVEDPLKNTFAITFILNFGIIIMVIMVIMIDIVTTMMKELTHRLLGHLLQFCSSCEDCCKLNKYSLAFRYNVAS